MAQYVAVRSYVNLHAHRNLSEDRSLVPKTLHSGTPRKSYLKNSKVNQFSPRSARKLIAPHLRMLKVTPRQETFLRCRCRCRSLSALADPDALTASDWVPVIDQVFLLLSITLTHMAGVTSDEKSFYHTQTRISGDNVVSENSSHPGSSAVDDTDVNLKFAWGIVEGKLMDSLSHTKDGVEVIDSVTELEQVRVKNPSSLSAIAEGPRFRLLLASFQWLQNEVVNISGNYATAQRSDFLVVLSEIIQKCWQPLSIAWMEKELFLVTSNPDKALLSFVVNKLNARDSLLRNIRKSGKEDLYAELIFSLRFGLARTDGFYNHSLFIQHGVAILEDLVIMLADGIASMYLELISVDSSLSIEMNSLGLSLCSLSTRALQRLRNEIALHQWLHQNMEAVVSMYEDRFDLLTLQRQSTEESSRSKDENLGWWKRLFLRSASVSSSLQFVVISHISVPVKRTKELRDLTGWRYYFSLFLELSDITRPIIKTVIGKVSDAISFFLVCLIGRSLGLIYSGIRQSLRWK